MGHRNLSVRHLTSTRMQQQQILVLLCACASAVWAAPTPQDFADTLGVLAPEVPDDLGRYDNMVFATMDVLPLVATAFEDSADGMGRGVDPINGERIGAFITGMMPVSRRLVRLQAEEEGRAVDPEQIRAL